VDKLARVHVRARELIRRGSKRGQGLRLTFGSREASEMASRRSQTSVDPPYEGIRATARPVALSCEGVESTPPLIRNNRTKACSYHD
jgi:hypothetical protein